MHLRSLADFVKWVFLAKRYNILQLKVSVLVLVQKLRYCISSCGIQLSKNTLKSFKSLNQHLQSYFWSIFTLTHMHTIFCMYVSILCWMESLLNHLFILSTLTLHSHSVLSSLSPPRLCPLHCLLISLAVSVSWQHCDFLWIPSGLCLFLLRQ